MIEKRKNGNQRVNLKMTMILHDLLLLYNSEKPPSDLSI